jgi:hypothetical protein
MQWGAKRVLGVSTALVFAATSACTEPQAAAKPMPEGETAYTCGSLIYGAAHYLKSEDHQADIDLIKGKSILAATKFGTIYATEENLDGMEAFNKMKIRGLLMSGTPSGNQFELSTDQHVQRAKACAEAV